MSKICTTIEQSKKLMELGLDIKTADMNWHSFDNIKPFVRAFPYVHENGAIEGILPAWSLSALLELMPNELELLSDECNFVPVLSRFCEDTDKFICCYDNGAMEHWYIEKEPLDAVYKMVCWLLENGYIK